MSTPDQEVAEKVGRAVDGQIYRLQEERRALERAAARIAAIDAELAILQTEKTRIDGRRPPRPDRGQGQANLPGNGTTRRD